METQERPLHFLWICVGSFTSVKYSLYIVPLDLTLRFRDFSHWMEVHYLRAYKGDIHPNRIGFDRKKLID